VGKLALTFGIVNKSLLKMNIETQNALENYECLKSLVDRKQVLESNGDEKGAESVQRMIDQFEGYPCYRVLIE